MKVFLHPSARVLGNSRIGAESVIMEGVTIGYPAGSEVKAGELPWEAEPSGAVLGDNAVIRPFSTIYSLVNIGRSFTTGHSVLLREDSIIGDRVLIGTNTVIENGCKIGNDVKVQSNVYFPTYSVIEDNVFVGPNAVLTNDRYPLRVEDELRAPRIKKGATLGANTTILPGVVIGEGAFVAAGSVVTGDVADWHLAVGCPAKISELPPKLKVPNRIIK